MTTTNLSLELLLLNDLLRTNAIDENIYSVAVQKLTATKAAKISDATNNSAS